MNEWLWVGLAIVGVAVFYWLSCRDADEAKREREQLRDPWDDGWGW